MLLLYKVDNVMLTNFWLLMILVGVAVELSSTQISGKTFVLTLD